MPCTKAWVSHSSGVGIGAEDELVYAYLVCVLYPKIHGQLAPFQGKPDIAYELSSKHSDEGWIKSGLKIWTKWREDSVAMLENVEAVLSTDIVGFYDNIELLILASDLKAICGDDDYVALLMTCLNRWGQPRGRGIPQGYSSSHILAKVYLHSLDKHLADTRFDHLRYVDDIRVFCGSHIEAQKGIIQLGKFLSKRGLNLQSAKTTVSRGNAYDLSFVLYCVIASKSEESRT